MMVASSDNISFIMASGSSSSLFCAIRLTPQCDDEPTFCLSTLQGVRVTCHDALDVSISHLFVVWGSCRSSESLMLVHFLGFIFYIVFIRDKDESRDAQLQIIQMFMMWKIKEDSTSCSKPDGSLAMIVDLCFYGMVDAILGFLRTLFYNNAHN
jgi:hypothetical protein